MDIIKEQVRCPECGRFLNKLASICPYCGAKPVASPGKPAYFCKKCGQEIPLSSIRPKKPGPASDILYCPYCGVKT
jgi:DNA-directed RNA polymerase subunit RPC12/RpoP